MGWNGMKGKEGGVGVEAIDCTRVQSSPKSEQRAEGGM